MKNNDVELIHRILDGDDTAFSDLVEKYQRQVHALAWRKIGDFHIAEEITQDTFLKAYQNLATLKKPHRFAGWLYVIATHCCHAWLRKKRIQTESLEELDSDELEPEAYSRYVAEQEAKAIAETQRQVVKKLLATLPESERTVITLHYFGEMTCEKMSEFLGVSANTIKSRLRRARNRLKKEEPMIREAISNFQISPNLTDNIMQEVARLKPAAPTGGKPLVPWAIAASSVVLIVLMLGIGSQYLARFQQPYNLDVQSEMAVELVDAPIVLNLEVKPDIQNRLGSSNVLSESVNHGEKPDEVIFAAAQAEKEDEVSVAKQQWIQSEPLAGSSVQSLLATLEGDLYTYAKGDIYKLPANEETWQHIFDISTLDHSGLEKSILAKWNNTLYYTQSSDLFTSRDDGKTWDLLYSWDNGKYWNPIELILTDQTFYIAFDSGVFSSKDTGKTWKRISDGLTGINSLVDVQNTLFAGTDNGFYRLDADGWKRLEFPEPIGWMSSVATTEGRLYVVAAVNLDVVHPEKVSRGLERGWWIFRSSDLGNSWEDITPTNAWTVKGFIPDAKLIATGETLLLMGKGMVNSTDGGKTWLPPQLPGTSPAMSSYLSQAVVVNTDTIYIGSRDGLHRSTDGGRSWDIVNITPDETGINNLTAFKDTENGQNVFPTLYGRVGGDIVKTTDRGKSWKTIQVEIPMTEPHREEPPSITHIIKSGGVIYAKGGEFPGSGSDTFGRIKTLLYRVSGDGRTLVPIQGMPFFDSRPLKEQLSQIRNNPFDLQDKPVVEQLKDKSVGATQFFEQLAKWDPQQSPDIYSRLGFRNGPFAVSNDTFYMEYNFKLFRWKQGDTEWHDTEQEETAELSRMAFKELKLAVSGNTVYVGKRDGRLVVSFDKGNNWVDLTPALPFPVEAFKEIVFAGPTVYVATDAGIIASDDGRDWHIVTDSERTNLIMEKLTVDGTTVYGFTKKAGVYLLESGSWKQVVSEVPDGVTSLAVNGDMLYVGTKNSGMLHFNLEK